MANPLAFLFDADGVRQGTSGGLVNQREAVFSPWPAEIGQGAPFSVWVEHEGRGEWHTSSAVELVRVGGATESGEVAIVTLTAETTLGGERLPSVSEEEVVARLGTSGVGATLKDLSGDLLAQLGGSATPQALVPPGTAPLEFRVVSGSIPTVQSSICRLFRWD